MDAALPGAHKFRGPAGFMPGNAKEVLLAFHISHRDQVNFVSLENIVALLLTLPNRRWWRTKVTSILIAIERASGDRAAEQLLVRDDVRSCRSLVRGGGREDKRHCGQGDELVLGHVHR